MDGVNEDAVRRMMEADSVPDYLMDSGTIRPLSERVTPATMTYDDLMDVLDRVYANPYGDQIEAARWPDETRAEAKRRLMRGVYEADMRAKYHSRPREFVQVDGKPYDTNNPWHFTNRYGMGGAGRVPAYMIGVYKDTPRLMMEHCARECAAIVTLRILSH